MLDALVQLEPAEALDTELAGQFAAIGIVKGEKFAPDARLRTILDEAVAVGNAASRTLGMGAHPTEGFRYYDDGDSAWWNMLFVGGFEFTNPPPMITPEGVKPFPNKGARQLHSRTSILLHRDRHHPGHVHAADRRRVAVPRRQRRRRRRTLRRREDLPGDACPRTSRPPGSGRSTSTTTRPAPCCRPRSATRGPAARCTPHPPPRPRPTAPPSSTSRPPSPTDVAAGQLDPDRPRQGLVRHPAPVQPAAALLRQDLATRRNRTPGVGAPPSPCGRRAIRSG